MAFITTGIATPKFDASSTTEDIAVGTRVHLSDGGEAMYCQASNAVAQYEAVTITVANKVVSLTTTTGRLTAQVGFAQTSLASAAYGWVQLSGRPKVKLAANCADQVPLFCTGTAGVLDDATVSTALVTGVTSKTTISNATAITCIVPSGAHVMLWQNPG